MTRVESFADYVNSLPEVSFRDLDSLFEAQFGRDEDVYESALEVYKLLSRSRRQLVVQDIFRYMPKKNVWARMAPFVESKDPGVPAESLLLLADFVSSRPWMLWQIAFYVGSWPVIKDREVNAAIRIAVKSLGNAPDLGRRITNRSCVRKLERRIKAMGTVGLRSNPPGPFDEWGVRLLN
jgi:hypothetical protein